MDPLLFKKCRCEECQKMAKELEQTGKIALFEKANEQARLNIMNSKRKEHE